MPGAEILVPRFPVSSFTPEASVSPSGWFQGCGKVGTGNVLTQPGPVDGFTVETCFIEFLLNWGTAPAESGGGTAPCRPGKEGSGTLVMAGFLLTVRPSSSQPAAVLLL